MGLDLVDLQPAAPVYRKIPLPPHRTGPSVSVDCPLVLIPGNVIEAPEVPLPSDDRTRRGETVPELPTVPARQNWNRIPVTATQAWRWQPWTTPRPNLKNAPHFGDGRSESSVACFVAAFERLSLRLIYTLSSRPTFRVQLCFSVGQIFNLLVYFVYL
ncbi:unnamed protein product [Macrosiphum euphorbiae]|uniref:Uncharacterized protein n=1 Tax=Macrosiphum euphorbiae TaxID=13131 RepID=A0AAV0WP70_9HEMI|nr:unnamed protein product [Macrosiphum euphorbiae]